ncbi:hypothetical protein A6R68_08261 [Neotoma lepida]|uniref:Tectonin beta-propeller repeat-containing protein 1 n=1 Tax=Neotoma lepida TaxID=56216 RepID=A0A1A6G353_NEOLE|nr:hypothetical protein A6R68_08261 [Neotoma lepida]
MPASVLWAVDLFGRVYTLSTAGQYWELCKDVQMEFKRVSAATQCCWGIACDNQVYLYVCSSDVPIRHREEAYENQRWNPMGGFCEKLLPSDRWSWSDVSGLQHRPLDGVALPSPHWEWESDWYVDENFGGEPTEKGIPSKDDPKELPDPFNDLSVGGWEITEEPVGRLSVWAVSLQGKVWYREDVSHPNPEGSSWSLVDTPGEVVQISCGPHDLVWGISCEDRAVYFRQGVTPSELSGKTWKAIIVGRESDRSHSGSSSSLLSDTDASSEVERQGPEQPLPKESLDDSRNLKESLSKGPETSRNTEPSVENACLAEGKEKAPEPSSADECHGPVSTPAELPWTNIDLKEPKRVSNQPAAGFPETTALSSLGPFPGMEEPYGADDHPLWAWVSGGGCAVEAGSVLKWQPEALIARTDSLSGFGQSVWVKTGALQWWCDWKPHKWVDVRVALEQFTGHDGARDSILFIYYVVHEEKKYLHVFLNEVTVLVPVLNEAKHSFALYTPERTRQRWPVRLAAATEQDMNDWLALLSLSCCESRKVHGRPSPQAIWSVTCKGDIFVSEPSPDLEAREHLLPCDQIGLPTDRYMWSDATGLQECTKAGTKPPSLQWTWVSDWYVDFSVPGGTDQEGWQYASDFPAKCKLVTSGPWLEVAPIALGDVSIIPESADADGRGHNVALWAVSDKGDVLCRLGVSELNPAGSSWLHVGTDQPFASVSIGACYQVWAVARDGSAFYRGSVSPSQPAGNLWYRAGITPSYPQGSSWEHVSNNVRKVSVGPLDQLPLYSWARSSNEVLFQVWVIANKVQGSHGLSRGTVCRRMGVQPREPKGQGWDYGIGGGWGHISVRANAIMVPRNVSREQEAHDQGPVCC